MKKIQFMIISLLLIFALTGCDSLNKEEIPSYEEFCLANPNDSTCLLEDNGKVNDVFLEFYNSYIENPDTFCDLYVDDTSSLKDDCDDMIATLLPEDLLDYEIVSVNDEVFSYISDYVIVFENVKDNTQVTVTVSFLYSYVGITIDALTYEVTVLDEFAEEALIEEIEKIIMEDLSLYLDDYNYYTHIFTEDEEAERINNWHIINNNNMYYEIGLHELNEDGSYTFYIYGVQNGVRILNDQLTVYPGYIDDELVIGYGEEYNAYMEKMSVNSLTEVIEFIAYQERTVDDVSKVFTLNDYSDIEELNEALQGHHDYVLTPSTDSDELYTLLIHGIYEDVTVTLRYSHDDRLDIHSLQLEEMVVTKVTTVDFGYLVEDFINRYNQHIITIEELNLYFTNEMPLELSEQYKSELFEIKDYEYYTIDGEDILWVFVYWHELFYNVDFVLQEDDTYKMTFTLDKDIDYSISDRISSDFDAFFTVLSDDVEGTCQLYFDDSSVSYCRDLFDHIDAYHYNEWRVIDKGDYLSIYFLFNRADLDISLSRYNMSVTYKELEDGSLEYDLVNSYFEEEEISGFLEDFTVAINDVVSTESIYDEFIVSNNNDLTEFIEYIRTNNYYITIEDSNIEYSNNYIGYNVYNSTDEFVKSVLMEFDVSRVEVDNMYTHKLEINSVLDVSLAVTKSEIEAYLNEIIEDINNNEYQKTEICKLYEHIFYPCDYEMADLYSNDYGLGLSDINLIRDDNQYRVIFGISRDSDNSNFTHQFYSDLFFYKIDGVIATSHVYKNVFDLPVEFIAIDKEDISNDFLAFLEELIDESTSDLELLNNYQNSALLDFIMDRDMFTPFVDVKFTATVMETDEEILNSYTFTDANGNSTEVVYILYNLYASLDSYSVLREGVNEDPVEFSNAELVAYLNGEGTLPVALRFYEVGTKNYLTSFLKENNYTLRLISEDDNEIECAIVDEFEEIVYFVSYIYWTRENMLNQNVLVASVDDVSSAEYTLLEEHISDLKSNIDLGTVTLDDLNDDINCYSIFPETYTLATVDSIILEPLSNGVKNDTYKVIVIYQIDDEEYRTIHDLTVTVGDDETTYTWTYLGYTAPTPDGPVASLEDATEVIKNFMSDLFNPEVTMEYIKDTYFMGMTLEDFDDGERNSVVLEKLTVEVTNVTPVLEDGLTVYYQCEMSISPISTKEIVFFNVIDLGNDQFYFVLVN